MGSLVPQPFYFGSKTIIEEGHMKGMKGAGATIMAFCSSSYFSLLTEKIVFNIHKELLIFT
ncbi:DUF1541 domain-containing protein [Ectobacillus funiculus]|uniref:DUF1541 domain-containing protein n=1 Tax=Ectobacillus funiculus TaxID=137993 RepID=UPI00397DF4A8